MPPTPARPRPKYNRDLIILTNTKDQCRRPRPGLGSNLPHNPTRKRWGDFHPTSSTKTLPTPTISDPISPICFSSGDLFQCRQVWMLGA